MNANRITSYPGNFQQYWRLRQERYEQELRTYEAQREYIDLNEKYQTAIVEYYRSQAELDRVVGVGLPAQ